MKNQTTNNEYIVVINQALDVCKKYEGGKFAPGELQIFFQNDLLRMGYLLASLDGVLDYTELNILCDTFGVKKDEKLLKHYFWEDVCKKNNFLQQIPKSIMYVICEERKQLADSFTIFLKDSRVLYKAIKQFGYAIISCNALNFPYQIVALEDLSKNVLNLILSAEDMDTYFEEMDIDKNNVSIDKLKSEDAVSLVHSTSNSGGQDIYKRSHPDVRYYDPYSGNKDFSDAYDVKRPNVSRYDDSANAKPPLGGISAAATFADAVSKAAKDFEDDDMTIQSILDDIDSMIGLENVKHEIHNLVNLLQVQKMRAEKGLKHPVMSNHLVFTGNPGTGKTTIARKISKIYKCLGLLEKGHLVETDRSGMVAGYMGQTAEKVTELINSAMGGILFIDEAYALSNNKMEGDFGQEAIDTLLKAMEDHRDNLIVIVAGYPEPMEQFLDSNPGLRSRFNKYIKFEDYSVSQLNDIFHLLCKEQDYKIAPDAEETLLLQIGQMVADSGDNFANAREIRNYFEQIVSRQATRIINNPNIDNDIDYLITIRKKDL